MPSIYFVLFVESGNGFTYGPAFLSGSESIIVCKHAGHPEVGDCSNSHTESAQQQHDNALHRSATCLYGVFHFSRGQYVIKFLHIAKISVIGVFAFGSPACFLGTDHLF